MAEHQWSLLCRRGIIDKYSNHLSIIELMDELSLEGELPDPLPDRMAVNIDAHLVSMWSRSDRNQAERFWQTITVTVPPGKEGKSEYEDAKAEGDLLKHQRTRLIASIKAIRFFGPGVYKFNIYYSRSQNRRGRLVAQVPLTIKAKLDLETAASDLETSE